MPRSTPAASKALPATVKPESAREARMNLSLRGKDHAATEILEQNGFAGYTVDCLVAEGAWHARVAANSYYELGRIVITLKALGSGAYGDGIAQIGISPDTARRAMGHVLAYHGASNQHRQPLLVLDVSKLDELRHLPPEELDAIANDPAKIDEIDGKTHSELKKMVREMLAQLDAKNVVAEKNLKKIQSLQEKLARTPPPTPEFLVEKLVRELDAEALACAARLSTSLRSIITRTLAAIDAHGADRQLIEHSVATALGRNAAALRDLAADCGILPIEASVLSTDVREDAEIWDAVDADLQTASTTAKKASRHA
ncbi:MAG: hypothetical protein VB141_12830 [Burkholderia gladioli]